MDESPRIAELRKKLEKDPGSRLFGQLAEELRKSGQFEEAIAVAQAGLEKNPNYPSARLTLARALLDSGRPSEACLKLKHLVKAAPDNILASRLLAEVLEELGEAEPALKQYERTLALSPADKALQAKIVELTTIRDAAARFDLRAAKAVNPPVAPAPTQDPGRSPETPAPPHALDRDLASGTISPGSTAVPDMLGFRAGAAGEAPASAPGVDLDATIGTGDLSALELREEAAEILDVPAMEPPPETFEPQAEPATDGESEVFPVVDTGWAAFEAAEPSLPVALDAPSDEVSAEQAHDSPDVGGGTLPLNSVTLADLYLRQGLKAEATAVLSRVLEEEPGNDDARSKLAAISDVSEPPKTPVPAEAPVAGPSQFPAGANERAIASLRALLSAIDREAIQQRASEHRVL